MVAHRVTARLRTRVRGRLRARFRARLRARVALELGLESKASLAKPRWVGHDLDRADGWVTIWIVQMSGSTIWIVQMGGSRSGSCRWVGHDLDRSPDASHSDRIR
jgi:hypothetical protein